MNTIETSDHTSNQAPAPSTGQAHQVDNSTEHLHKALDGQPDDWSNTHPAVAPKPLRFSFSGRGRDYLSLWLTNWIFTIATLGIYSAWAKVRRLQYVHQNTQLGGYAFGFHGEAQRILIGRIIGIGLLLASNAASTINFELTGLATLLFFLCFPWLYRSSIRFYTRNTSYRNVRFRFTGTTKELIGIYIKSGILIVLTMGFAFPYVAYRLRRYRVENSRWGNNQFQFTSSVGAFFGIYLINVVVTLLVLVGLFVLAALFSVPFMTNLPTEVGSVAATSDEESISNTVVMIGALYAAVIYAVYLISRVLTQDMIFKETWNHVNIGQTRFSCDLSVIRLYFIRYGCFIASVLTLGFFIPFAHMIITKRRIESISVTPAHDFDVAQATFDDDTTRSAEVADMFDIDIGW